jgi:phage/plasmid-associated DNA primase
MLRGSADKFTRLLSGFHTDGDKVTNTIIPSITNKKAGKFMVPKNRYHQFINEYCDKIRNHIKPSVISQDPNWFDSTDHPEKARETKGSGSNDELFDSGIVSLTEMFQEGEPTHLIADLDIKYKGEVQSTKITQKTLKTIHTIFAKQLLQHFPSGAKNINTIGIFTSRSKPYYNKHNDTTSDGIHAHFPFIVTDGNYTTLLRNQIYKEIYAQLSETGTLNDAEHTYDERVAKKKGPWSLYGSYKGDCPPYLLNCVYRTDNGESTCITKKFPKFLTKLNEKNQTGGKNQTIAQPIDLLVKLLSVKLPQQPSDFINSDIRSQLQGEYAKFTADKRRKKIEREQKVFVEETGMEKIYGVYEYELQEIRELLSCFSMTRTDDYDQWICVGIYLYIYSPELLPIWQEFSAQCPKKYDPDVCELKWATFKDNPLIKQFTKAKLRSCAHFDNPLRYDQVRIHHVYDMLYMLSKNVNAHDIALILFQMYGKKIKATIESQGDKSIWWVFRGHTWHNEDPRYHLLKYMSTVLVKECEGVLLSMDINSVYQGMSNDAVHKGIYKIMTRLKDPGPKSAILRECELLFLDKDFLKIIDQDPLLFPMQNGVYDFHTFSFRNGRPEDYCTLSSPVTYDPKARNANLVTFIKQILPIPELYHFILERMALCLTGVFFRYFVFAYGKGLNGKSKLLNNLMKVLLGDDYFTTQESTLVTTTRKGAGTASPEIMDLRNKRQLDLEEPDMNDKFNSGFVKWMLSGADITGRGLFSKIYLKFKQTGKLFLLSNNYLQVDDQSLGFWERILVAVFPSKFCDNPDKDPSKFQFKRDPNIERYFQEWAPSLFNLLLPYVQNYLRRGQIPYTPNVIKKSTAKYKASSNYIQSFAMSNLIKTKSNTDFVSVQEIYTRFSEWYRYNKGRNIPDSRQVSSMLESYYFNVDVVMDSKRKSEGWYGYVLKQNQAEFEVSGAGDSTSANKSELDEVFDENLASYAGAKKGGEDDNDFDDYNKFNSLYLTQFAEINDDYQATATDTPSAPSSSSSSSSSSESSPALITAIIKPSPIVSAFSIRGNEKKENSSDDDSDVDIAGTPDDGTMNGEMLGSDDFGGISTKSLDDSGEDDK